MNYKNMKILKKYKITIITNLEISIFLYLLSL